MRVHIGSADNGTWALLVVIPIDDQTGRCSGLVHCALPCEREHRIEAYLEHLVRHPESLEEANGRGAALTRREKDVLESLAAGRCLREASRELHVSYSTVRNHVQHILLKLGVHSIQEATALWLLRDPTHHGAAGPHRRA